MKILNNQGKIDRLLTALISGSSFKEKNLTIPGVQQSSISQDLIRQIYGAPEDFLKQYSFFEEDYFQTISDKKNLKLTMQQSTFDVDLMRKQGRIDLNILNYGQKQRLTDMFRERILKMDELLSTVGFPSMEFDSSNLYRSLLKFNVNMGEAGDELHPMAVLLNRMFYNIDTTKVGLDIFPISGNQLTASALSRAGRMTQVQQRCICFIS